MLENNLQEGMLATSFSYTNEFGCNASLSKTFDSSILMDGEFHFLVDEFKNFLLAIGFPNDKVEKIIVEEWDE